MRKVLLLLVGTAVLWLPAVSVAGDSSPSQPAKLAAKKETPQVKSEASSRASTCRCVSTIAAHTAQNDGKDSAESQGEESQGEESQGKESQGKDSANPAMTCKSMQSNDLTHFQAAFGTRPNAFGKCVAKQANSKKS